jgi:hypothetical protein
VQVLRFAVEAGALVKQFSNIRALDELSLRIEQGENIWFHRS